MPSLLHRLAALLPPRPTHPIRTASPPSARSHPDPSITIPTLARRLRSIHTAILDFSDRVRASRTQPRSPTQRALDFRNLGQEQALLDHAVAALQQDVQELKHRADGSLAADAQPMEEDERRLGEVEWALDVQVGGWEVVRGRWRAHREGFPGVADYVGAVVDLRHR